MSLFDTRNYYKPFEYEWAFEAYDTMQKMHWLPSEVPLHEDVRDWNERLTQEEKNLISYLMIKSHWEENGHLMLRIEKKSHQIRKFQIFPSIKFRHNTKVCVT